MMHLYSTLLCIAYTPKALYNHMGGLPQPPPVCSIHDDAMAATGQWHQCAHHNTGYRWRGERVIEPYLLGISLGCHAVISIEPLWNSFHLGIMGIVVPIPQRAPKGVLRNKLTVRSSRRRARNSTLSSRNREREK